MAQKTKQQQIELLKSEVQEWKDRASDLDMRIQELQEKADKDFENSQLYHKLLYKIDFLEKFYVMGQKNIDMMERTHQKDLETIQKLSQDNKILANRLNEPYEIDMNLSETESHDLKELEDKLLIMTAQNASKDELIHDLYKKIDEQWEMMAELQRNAGKKAGRKELKVDVREQILMLRSILDSNGKPMSIRKIAKTVGCSVGVVHKYISAQAVKGE